ncbi:hypothetical protein JOB18_020981 [Solea senegalensis]|uniref:Uncharacterized protein n=1 Tax=Solea senegalensis TaxID=28829 RepID=A0AAV6RT66_SOLSE|nr:hypothetical protein JOB18_020981 [Solea senegalensis]
MADGGTTRVTLETRPGKRKRRRRRATENKAKHLDQHSFSRDGSKARVGPRLKFI